MASYRFGTLAWMKVFDPVTPLVFPLVNVKGGRLILSLLARE